ncbi:RRM 1 domain containing protein [Asbolus verrucosus]|uniref:RRM 1 domain containing protein n=1 Tax=Asbolus verrucosus TaxID=1661398 RepID=A0A482W530_ASBVE|nr:RRM 1 domain containing protein [Asbolus verrucosus]
MVDEARTLWCGNLSDKVTEELLYELFLQVAPLERVRIPTDKEGRKSDFAFITLKHEVSVDYVVQLLNGTSLYDRRIKLKPRSANQAHQLEQQNMMHNFNDLFLMGHMMQLTYNNYIQHSYNNQRPAFNNDRFGRDDSKPYKYYRHDYNSGRQGRSNHQRNNHRNHNDRTRRQRYY